MDLAEVILSVIPWLEGVVDVARVKISALPAWGVVTFPIILLAAGGYYVLQHFKLAPNPFKEDNWDDDNW